MTDHTGPSLKGQSSRELKFVLTTETLFFQWTTWSRNKLFEIRGIWEPRFHCLCSVDYLEFLWQIFTCTALSTQFSPRRLEGDLRELCQVPGLLNVLWEYPTIISKWLGPMRCCILHKLPLALTGVILCSLPFRKLSGSRSGWPLLHFVRRVLGVGQSCCTKLMKDWSEHGYRKLTGGLLKNTDVIYQ